MNDIELEKILTESLENTKEPDPKSNLSILNQAKVKCNLEYQTKQDRKFIVLALLVLLPFSIIATAVVSYLFISNLVVKVLLAGIGIIGMICILTVGIVACLVMKKQKGVLVE